MFLLQQALWDRNMITAILAKNTDSSNQPLTDWSAVNAFQCKTKPLQWILEWVWIKGDKCALPKCRPCPLLPLSTASEIMDWVLKCKDILQVKSYPNNRQALNCCMPLCFHQGWILSTHYCEVFARVWKKCLTFVCAFKHRAKFMHLR